MPFELWVGFRYLMSKRSSVFVSFISVMTVLGVVLGVAALNVTLSVMSGFEEDLKSKIIGMNAHAVVLSHLGTFTPDADVEKKIRSFPHVTGVTPFTYNELLIQSGSQSIGTVLKGADPKTIGQVTDLVKDVCLDDELEPQVVNEKASVVDATGDECGKHRGTRMKERQALFDEVGKEHEVNDEGKTVPGILLGKELADQLLVIPGETVHLIAPALGSGPGAFPKIRTFYVVGIFRTGMWEYDQKFAFTSIDAADRMSGDDGKIAGWEIKTDNLYGAPRVAEQMQDDLQGYPWLVKSWRDLNGALFNALGLEKIVMGLLLSIIVIVASFSIVSILTLIVLEKAKEIAILKSMGASDGMILGVFATQGFTIGLAGVLLGTGVGYVLAVALKAIKWKLDTDVYYLDSLPVNIQLVNFVVVALAGILITFAATLLPSWIGARQRPVQGLAYE